MTTRPNKMCMVSLVNGYIENLTKHYQKIKES